MLILVVYFLGQPGPAVLLPQVQAAAEFNVVKHVILPVLGMAAIAVPVYYLCKPGSPTRTTGSRYAALASSWCFHPLRDWLVRRDPGIGDRVGSIVADE